jgi:hypothetical protein
MRGDTEADHGNIGSHVEGYNTATHLDTNQCSARGMPTA